MLTFPRWVSVAPMIDCTDRHFRYLMRLITKHTWLYTEMITVEALKHGDFRRLLQYEPCEHPLALQLGGSDPKTLANAAKLGADFGYDEINLNVGCPSDRVQAGKFGACLMKTPDLVAECVHAMQQAVPIPVTVKTRIGVDTEDSYEFFQHFIETVASTGCSTFIVHARKAWLQGLSPKQNREIPPLCYDTVFRLKQEFPNLEIILNGGLKEAKRLHGCDGIMIGREAYSNPMSFQTVDRDIYLQGNNIATREEVMVDFGRYIARELALGTKLNSMMRHLLGLSLGVQGGRKWRRYISENIHRTTDEYSFVNGAYAKWLELTDS